MQWEALQDCLKGGFGGPTSANRLTIGIPMAIFTLIGIHLNFVLYRIISIQKDFIKTPFKRHVISLICSNIGFNLVGLFALVFIVACNIHFSDPVLVALCTPDSFFYQVILYSNLSIALDRFMTFITPKVYEHFTGAKHFIFVLSPWLAAGWIVGHSTLLGCYKRFNPYTLRFQYGCSNCPFFLDLNTYLAIYLPLAILILYIAIFMFIVRKKLSMGSQFSFGKQKKDIYFIRRSFIAWSKGILMLDNQSFTSRMPINSTANIE